MSPFSPPQPALPKFTTETPALPPPHPFPPLSDELRGSLLMAFGAVCWAFLAFFVHIGATFYHFPTAASVLVRALVNILLSALYIVARSPPSLAPTAAHLRVLVARSVAGALGCLCIFTALKHIPVGNAVTLFCTSPVITTVLSALFLHEPITLVDIVSLVTNFAGVLFVAQPPFLFDHVVDAIPNANPTLGAICALLAACCASTVYTLIRSLGLRVHFILNVVSLGFGLLPLALVMAGPQDLHHMLHNAAGLCVNVMGSVAGFGCVACFSRGLQFCRAGPAMVIRTMDIPMSFVLGYCFLDERLSGLTALGVVLVVAASLAISLQSAFRKVPPQAEGEDASEPP